MNSITVISGYMVAILLVCVSSKNYHIISDEKKVTVNNPYNFVLKQRNEFSLIELTLKSLPQSVTTVDVVFSRIQFFYSTDTKTARNTINVNGEIENGEVKIMILRSFYLDLYYTNILIDVELHTSEGLCNTARVAEGRIAEAGYYYDSLNKLIKWDTNWKYNDSGACLAPKLCEIVVNFPSQCEDNLKCYYDANKYICTFYGIKMRTYKLYQAYNIDMQKTTPTFRNDYTYLNAEDSFYKFHSTKKNWQDAKQECEKEGASLFYPENRDEVNTVIMFWKNNTKSVTAVYVGISDIDKEDTFVTIDGKPVSEVFNNWNSKQPDNYYNNEDCVHMNIQAGYNDIPCQNSYNFICKKRNLDSVIGAPLNISAGYTRFIIELESFDVNSSVHVKTSKNSRDNPSPDTIIALPKDLVKKSVKEQIYSETTEVQFSCEKYKSESKYVYLAIIDKTEKKIQTLEDTLLFKQNITKVDSGSILCCIFYVYNSDGKENNITRFVVNKTLFTYQLKKSMSSKPAGLEDQWSPSTKINYIWVYLSAAVLGVSVLILALYLILKKRWCTNSQPLDENVELDQTTQDQVLYADLDLHEYVNYQPPNQNAESHYANIVGVLHPL